MSSKPHHTSTSAPRLSRHGGWLPKPPPKEHEWNAQIWHRKAPATDPTFPRRKLFPDFLFRTPTVTTPPDITVLLTHAANGDRRSSDALLPLVYDQLRRIAQERMNHERSDHTLQATALVHEAYARLVGAAPELGWANRAHFFFAAAEAMRRILVDHARARGRIKRGGQEGKPAKRLPISVLDLAAADNSTEILAVDDAIRRLEEADEVAAAVVRLRFFATLSVEDTARALNISDRTVQREWAYARAILLRDLERQRPE